MRAVDKLWLLAAGLLTPRGLWYVRRSRPSKSPTYGTRPKVILSPTPATLLGELGVAAGVIGARLGHVPSNITQHYARATQTAMREAVELLATHYEKGT